jgi:hypothetical protein
MSDNEEYVKQLEAAIGQMLKPLKNIPFGLVIKSMTGFEVIQFDRDKVEDKNLLQKISQAAEITGREIAGMGGIKRPRPNEVGNDLEPFIEKALKSIGYADTRTPKGKSGKGKAVGYPDREFTDNGRAIYLELKSYAKESLNSTMRSFYLSPSDDFKVNKDALHLLIAFEIVREGNAFFVSGWKIITVDKLLVDVKYEFNSDNKRLYASHAVLVEEKFNYKEFVE